MNIRSRMNRRSQMDMMFLNVSQDVLMDFEQELLDMDDIMPEDSTPPLIVPPAEICVNSEHQVDRVSDVVVLKLKLEF